MPVFCILVNRFWFPKQFPSLRFGFEEGIVHDSTLKTQFSVLVLECILQYTVVQYVKMFSGTGVYYMYSSVLCCFAL
jgi:hypothetical protein